MRKFLIFSTVFLLLTACNKENTETTTPAVSFSGKLKSLKFKSVGVPDIDTYYIKYDSITSKIKEVIHNNATEIEFSYEGNYIFINDYINKKNIRIKLSNNNSEIFSELDTITMSYYDEVNTYFNNKIDSVKITIKDANIYSFYKGISTDYQYVNGNCVQYIHNYWDRGTPFPYPFKYYSDTITMSFNNISWNKYVPFQFYFGQKSGSISGGFEYANYINYYYYIGFNDINSSIANRNLISSTLYAKFEYTTNAANQITKVTTYDATTGEKIGYVTLEYYP